MISGIFAIGLASLVTFGVISLLISKPKNLYVAAFGVCGMVFLWGIAIPQIGNLTLFGFKVWTIAGVFTAIGTLFYFAPGSHK